MKDTGSVLSVKLQQLLAERTPVYEHVADFTVDTDGKTPIEVAREIVDGVDFVVNPRFEGKPTRKASSIVAFGEGGEVQVIRE